MTTTTVPQVQSNTDFMTVSNSIDLSLREVENKHIIPVFTRDNIPTISQAEFVSTVLKIGDANFGRHINLDIKTSHPIKGRTFEARYKKAEELLPYEKTLYYERMAFLAEYPITQKMHGQDLFLTIAGIKAYNRDNLNTVSNRTDQRFQIAIGFKVQVCTNMCINSDGAVLDLRVRSLAELEQKVTELVEGFHEGGLIRAIEAMGEYHLSAQQFANFIGRVRMYQYLPSALQKQLPLFSLSDTQMNAVSKAYLRDKAFAGSEEGISIWNFYNLLTDAVKSSFVDTFLEKGVNAFEVSQGIMCALAGDEDSGYNWFLN
jgi:hypothetical protein